MKWKNKGALALWLIVLCVALYVTGTYAAYVSIWSFKSVAVASSQEIRFSSNYLSRYLNNDKTMPLKAITVDAGSGSLVTVTVCNYQQNDTERVHAKNITYTLGAKIVAADGSELDPAVLAAAVDALTIRGEISVMDNSSAITNTSDTKNFSNQGELTFPSATLEGGTTSQNLFAVSCANQEVLEKVAIEMTATPTACGDGCGVTNFELKARLYLASSKPVAVWTGAFNRDDSDSRNVDAFNYEMSGTAVQTMRLKWNPDYVTLGKWSQPELPKHEPAATDTDNFQYIDLPLGDEGVTSYRVQFYRTGEIPEGESWTMVDSYVQFQLAE